MKKCQLFSIPTDMLRYVRVSLYACRICIVLTPTVLKTSACYVAIFVTPAFCTPYLARMFCREFHTLSPSLAPSLAPTCCREFRYLSFSLSLSPSLNPMCWREFQSLALSRSNVLPPISLSHPTKVISILRLLLHYSTWGWDLWK